ncbi:protein-methionine-sulfoxide reductase heme-binding subunit MsrQ [Thalassotalea sp. PLHSN55]|uniref:protein-methionine-sulfoxide reductase heme-binding subunit MsrQ n=1 Tax=Thalassotalea sp. PLHSN55 TaxID=3435888 RepID=UPI003F876BB7
MNTRNKVLLLKIFIHLSAMLPLVYYYYLAIADDLGGDPVEAIIHFTGIGAFNLLLITLLVSPMAKKIKQGYLLQVRRLLGIYTFVYAFCHVVNFFAFEVQFDVALFVEEVIKRPYVLIGMLAFVLLIALTITSLSRLKKKMGKRWQTLHNSIYLVAILIAWHFYWSVKSEISSPLFYVFLTLLVLSMRKSKIKKILFTS